MVAAEGGARRPSIARAERTGRWLSDVALDTLGISAAEIIDGVAPEGAVARRLDAGDTSALWQAASAAADALLGRFDEAGAGWLVVPLSASSTGDQEATVLEAGALRRGVDRPNAVAGVPAGCAGAVETLASQGVPVSIGPLYSIRRLDSALDSYFRGLETLSTAGRPLTSSALILRFGLAALDATLDRIFQERLDTAPMDSVRAAYRGLLGNVGMWTAKRAYRRLETELNSARFDRLARLGAGRPLLVWEVGQWDASRIAQVCGGASAAAVTAERAESGWPELSGAGLLEEAEEAGRKLDKLANYQIDLDVIAGELE